MSSVNKRKWLSAWLSLGLVFSPALSSEFATACNDQEDEIVNRSPSIWAPSFNAGLEQSQINQKPLLVIFGAEWCSWCRKLEAELEAAEATQVRTDWTLAKVDVDVEEDLAEKFGVRALPTIVIVDGTGAKIESVEGYMPVDQLAGWLEEQRSKAISTLDAALQEAALANPENIAKWVSFLGDRRSSIRQLAKQKFLQHRSDASLALLPVLEGGTLAQRLSLLELLEKWKAPEHTLDPWHPETFDADGLDSLKSWLENEAGKAAAEMDASKRPNQRIPSQESEATDPDDESSPSGARQQKSVSDELAKYLNRWKAVTGASMTPLLEEAFLLTEREALIDGLRGMIQNDELDDTTKTLVRFAYYSLLSGPVLRTEHAGLLKSLASQEELKRRRAGVAIAKKLTNEDAQLLRALIEDPDSIIREASVEVISQVDDEHANTWLEQLLKDPDKNVRGMSLKTLAPALSRRAVPIVATYLPSENDENLIVQAFKFLSTDSDYKVDETYLGLVPFLNHEQWRVRAEAAEVLGTKLSRQSMYNRGNKEDVTTQLIIEGLATRLLDPDSFVRAKVQQHLPLLVNVKTLPKLAPLIVENISLLDQVLESSTKSRNSYGMYGYDDSKQNVADYLIGLKSEDKSVRLISAIFLAESKPERTLEELSKQLDTDSPILKSRIVYHAIRSFNAYRETETSGFLLANISDGASSRTRAETDYSVADAELETDMERNQAPGILGLFDLFGPPRRGPSGPLREGPSVTAVEAESAKSEESVKATDTVDIDDFFGGSKPPSKVVESDSDNGKSSSLGAALEEPDLFGVASNNSNKKPNSSTSTKSSDASSRNKARNFHEWMGNWNSDNAKLASKEAWKAITMQFLDSGDTTDRQLGLLLAPIVGVPYEQSEWLEMLSKEEIQQTAANVVGWLPGEWTEQIGAAWKDGDKGRNQIFLKNFTATVEPNRLIWLVKNKKRFATDFHESYIYVSGCMRVLLGVGVRYSYPNFNSFGSVRIERAKEDVRVVAEELIELIKQNDSLSVFSIAVLLELFPKDVQSLAQELLVAEQPDAKRLAASALVSKDVFANQKTLDSIRVLGSEELDRWLLEYLWGNKFEQSYSDWELLSGSVRPNQQAEALLRFLKIARRGTVWKEWLGQLVEKNDLATDGYRALMQIAIDPNAPITLLESYPGNTGSEQSLNLVLTAVVTSGREDAAKWLVDHFEELRKESNNEYLQAYYWSDQLKSRKGEWAKLRVLIDTADDTPF